jgi:hypothetical protein
LRRLFGIIVAEKRAISITYSVFMSVALVMRHAKRMRRMILSSVTCLPLPHAFTSSHKRHDFWGKKVIDVKYAL